MVPPDVYALSATPGPSVKSARCDQPLLGGVATTWAIGPEERVGAIAGASRRHAHGDRKTEVAPDVIVNG